MKRAGEVVTHQAGPDQNEQRTLFIMADSPNSTTVTAKIPAEIEGLVLRAIATANARRASTVPAAGTHGALTMETLIFLLLEDVAYTQSRPGSWEGAGMNNVLFAHGYDVEPRW